MEEKGLLKLCLLKQQQGRKNASHIIEEETMDCSIITLSKKPICVLDLSHSAYNYKTKNLTNA